MSIKVLNLFFKWAKNAEENEVKLSLEYFQTFNAMTCEYEKLQNEYEEHGNLIRKYGQGGNESEQEYNVAHLCFAQGTVATFMTNS